ncbi:MAG: Rieske 2Fe-2S domain-containing protein [Alphaproteobacteria bacterium]|nr:Rieske 2Fe-2S domain-containing protein [Alphaproteobacteria bacterium]
MDGPEKLQLADLEQVGPGTPAGRYFRKFWQPIMRARDLPPGRPKPVEMLGEKFTIYRGEGGSAYVTAYRCPHRGTPLSLGWVEGDSLRCRYHGWRFEGDGQCVEQPNEDRPFCDRIQVRTYPSKEYAGLIFAYLGDDPAPPFRTIPDLDQPGVIVADPVEMLPCNYWNKFDNDHGHIPWVHRATGLRTGRDDILVLRQEVMQKTEFGMVSKRHVKGAKGDVGGALGAGKLSYFIMPNIRLFFGRTRAKGFEDSGLWDTKVVWMVPVHDQKFEAFDVTHTPIEGKEAEAYAEARYSQQEAEAEFRWDLAAKILDGEMSLDELPDYMGAYTSFAIEDYVTQVGMGPLAERSKENLAATDTKLAMLRRLWLDEVTALLDGRPTTDWKLPDEPLSEYGVKHYQFGS